MLSNYNHYIFDSYKWLFFVTACFHSISISNNCILFLFYDEYRRNQWQTASLDTLPRFACSACSLNFRQRSPIAGIQPIHWLISQQFKMELFKGFIPWQQTGTSLLRVNNQFLKFIKKFNDGMKLAALPDKSIHTFN